MSLDATDWVWGYSQSKGVARLVMLAIADRARGDECTAYASLSMLQRMANAGSKQSVVSALQQLLDSGELEIVEGEAGPYGAAVYRLPKALGHVRQSRKSVQPVDRSVRTRVEHIGPVTGPIDGPGPDAEGRGAPQIGPETGPKYTETGPISSGENGPETGPIAQSRGVIGPKTGPIGPQIGPVFGPLNKEHKELQEEIDISSGATGDAAEGKPQRKNTRSRKPLVVAEGFDDFWRVYPKRKDKGDAEAAWNKAITDVGAKPQAVIDAAALYAMQRKGQDPTWTKLPATWLNKRCWEDEPDPDYVQPSLDASPADSRTGHRAWRNPTDPHAYDGDL